MASAVDGGDLATWEPEPGDYPRTPGGSRVTFSREANRTHEYFPVEGAESSDLDVNVLPSISSSEGSGPQSGVKRRKRSKRAKKSRAKDAPKHPAGSQVGKVVGACSGEGLPRVSRSQSSSSFQSLGLDYSELGTTADISLSAAAGEWGHTNRSRSVEPEMVTSPTSSLQMPAPVMMLPTDATAYRRSSELVAAQSGFVAHRRHVSDAQRMIDLKTPHGYRNYRQRHNSSNPSGIRGDGLHKWLARDGHGLSSLAPLSKMTAVRPRARSRSSLAASHHDAENELYMGDFYSQMHAIEEQMHEAPLCLAHKLMARLSPDPLLRGLPRGMPKDVAVVRIQASARGRQTRNQLEWQKNEKAASSIQARVRGNQTRKERKLAHEKAAAEAEAAAAVWAKEEEEARIAEAAAAREEEEARIAVSALSYFCLSGRLQTLNDS